MAMRPGDLLADLPHRFRGDGAVAGARYRVRVGRTVRDVVVSHEGCRVEAADGVVPDVEIVTDPLTWQEIDSGRLSGIEAFNRRRLMVRGSIESSLRFEPLFDRPHAGGLRYSIEIVDTGRAKISTLVAGDIGAPPLLLLHGLGATKASWLTAIPHLARRYRVYALDLPGFGGSSKPVGKYDAPWFADHVAGFLDELGYTSAFIAGNSMGGRIAMELSMRASDRVMGIACLCPAAAFTRRPVAPRFIRLLRPELGMLAARLPRARLREGLVEMFADPSRIDESWFDAALDDFIRSWKSPRARLAFFAAARNIYLDEPFGEQGFWARLEKMTTPALFVYGRRDTLITSRFAGKVRRAIPKAKVLVWDDCGHVPQLEHPVRTARTIQGFFDRIAAELRPA